MIFLVLPDLPEEDLLLARARQGDQDAILRIYRLYFPPIYGYIRLRVGDRALAEDIASEVFLRFVTVIAKRQAPRHSLRGWLFKVARTLSAAHYAEAQKMPLTTLEDWVPAPPDDDPEVQFIRSVSIERARRMVRMLAPEQQEVLVLRFGQRLSLQETSDIMGKSVSAIKSLQYRATETLRQLLREAGSESGERQPGGIHV
jgi:RNA polymerase sigma-70 factor (ECF subfamily)